MSEHDETEMPSAPAPIAADNFAAFAALLALIVDEKACAQRLQQLREITTAATEAQAGLVAARAVHDADIAQQQAAMATELEDLRKRQIAVRAQEGILADRERIVAEQQRALDRRSGRYEQVGSVTREFVPGYPRDNEPAVQPYEGVTDDVLPDDGFERVAGTTITREPSSPRPRKTMRRGSEI